MHETYKAWCAGFVRRWHMNHHLCDTVDYTSGHQQRCAILLLKFWPDASREEIISTLTHDQGEFDSGDMSYTAKRKHPSLKEMLEVVEADSIRDQGLPPVKYTSRIAFVDRLDSYLWMLRHAPHLRLHDDWMSQMNDLLEYARIENIYLPTLGLINETTSDCV